MGTFSGAVNLPYLPPFSMRVNFSRAESDPLVVNSSKKEFLLRKRYIINKLSIL